MRTSMLLVRHALLALPLLACGGASPPPATAPTATAAMPGDATQGGTALIPGGSAGSKKADRASNPAWSACHSSFKPASADLGAEVGKMAQGCASVTKMHVVGETFKGHQSASNPPQSFKLKAQAKHCYRAYAAAAGAIADLDLLIKDSEGAVAGEDSTDDPTPVIIEDGAVCFKADDDASVVVSVGSGEGDYAVQVWSD
jgi:hypothetical protein